MLLLGRMQNSSTIYRHEPLSLAAPPLFDVIEIDV
jgi:hypothetical protein